jgi:hypothetical protein
VSARPEKAFTARNWPIAKAPKRITLLGDRAKPEPATHIIEFPGGAIELSRINDREYWAHIIVNRKWALDEMDGTLHGAIATVVDSRVFVERVGLREVVPEPADRAEVSQIAVLIRTEEP